ncbi:hypothetical protein ACWC3Y_10640 [Streptomyces sp. NPDC001296]
MSPEANGPGSTRPAAEWNEAIRCLLRRAFGRPLTDEERAEYEVLVEGWDAAVKAETDIVEAA